MTCEDMRRAAVYRAFLRLRRAGVTDVYVFDLVYESSIRYAVLYPILDEMCGKGEVECLNITTYRLLLASDDERMVRLFQEQAEGKSGEEAVRLTSRPVTSLSEHFERLRMMRSQRPVADVDDEDDEIDDDDEDDDSLFDDEDEDLDEDEDEIDDDGFDDTEGLYRYKPNDSIVNLEDSDNGAKKGGNGKGYIYDGKYGGGFVTDDGDDDENKEEDKFKVDESATEGAGYDGKLPIKFVLRDRMRVNFNTQKIMKLNLMPERPKGLNHKPINYIAYMINNEKWLGEYVDYGKKSEDEKNDYYVLDSYFFYNGDKYSKELRQIINIAFRVAENYGVKYVGSEHLLYAMLVCDNTANEVLYDTGIDPVKFKQYFEHTLEKGFDFKGISPCLRDVLEHAEKLGDVTKDSEKKLDAVTLLFAFLDYEKTLAKMLIWATGVNLTELGDSLKKRLTGGDN